MYWVILWAPALLNGFGGIRSYGNCIQIIELNHKWIKFWMNNLTFECKYLVKSCNVESRNVAVFVVGYNYWYMYITDTCTWFFFFIKAFL